MSLFPTGTARGGQCTASAERDPRLETDGVLVRPISGQIYLIEELDLETHSGVERRPRLSGLVSRH